MFDLNLLNKKSGKNDLKLKLKKTCENPCIQFLRLNIQNVTFERPVLVCQ